MNLRPADLRGGVDEVALRVLGTEGSVRDINRAVKTVVFWITSTMVSLELGES